MNKTVGVSQRHPYVFARMNLLLLLSALLSALTGVSARAANPQQVQAVAQEQTVRQAPVAVAPHPIARPSLALPALPAVAESQAIVAPLVSAIPAWVDRRRE